MTRALPRTLLLLTTSVVTFGAARQAAAGPWVDPEPGHGFVQITYSRYQADQYFAGPGEIDGSTIAQAPIPRGTRRDITIPLAGGFLTVPYKSNYLDQSASLYGEVSLLRGLGAVISMPMVRNLTQDIRLVPPAQLSSQNVGDLTFGLKYQIPRIRALRGFAFGPQLFVTLPTGDQNARAAYPKELNTPDLPLPTGNGTLDIEARGSFGYALYPIPMFIVADVGYRHRITEAACADEKNNQYKVNYSDDVPWDVQVGGTWAPKKKYFDHATLIATVSGLKSLENGDVPGQNGLPTKQSPFTQPCGQANNQTSLSLGGTLMLFPIRWIGVTYTVSHTLTGVNTGYGLTNMVGLATEF